MGKTQKKTKLLQLIEESNTHSDLNSALKDAFITMFLTSKVANIKTLLTEIPQMMDSLESFNVQELIFMHLHLGELVQKLEELRNNVTTQLQYKKQFCGQHAINFEKSLVFNFVNHFNCDQQTYNVKKYNSTVVERLYPPQILDRVQGIEGYRNIFSVRLKTDNTVECLLCDYGISQTKLDNLWDHICGVSHMKQLEIHYEGLLKYHHFWMSYKADNQLFYRYHDDINLKCTKCNKLVSYTEAFPHLDVCPTYKHKRETATKLKRNLISPLAINLSADTFVVSSISHWENIFGLWKTTQYNSVVFGATPQCDFQELPKEPISLKGDVSEENSKSTSTNKQYEPKTNSLHVYEPDDRSMFETFMSSKHKSFRYSPSTFTQLFEGLPYEWIGGLPYPIMQRVGIHIVCLLCNNNFIPKSIDDHLKYNHLLDRSKNRKELGSVKKYLNVWSTLPGDVHTQQVYFKRLKCEMTCQLCMINVSYKRKNVILHLNTEEHKNKLINKNLKIKEGLAHGDFKQTPNFVPLKFVYSDLPYKIIEGKRYPVMQRTNNKVFCMVCSIFVYDDVFRHFNGKYHNVRDNRRKILPSIKKYHDFWSDSPVEVQMQQLFFKLIDRNVRCSICWKFLPCNATEIGNHIKSALHQELLNEKVYHLRSDVRPDTKTFSIDVNIKQCRREEASISETTAPGLKESSTSTLAINLAADHFVFSSISHWENIFGLRKTLEYNCGEFGATTTIKGNCPEYVTKGSISLEEKEENLTSTSTNEESSVTTNFPPDNSHKQTVYDNDVCSVTECSNSISNITDDSYTDYESDNYLEEYTEDLPEKYSDENSTDEAIDEKNGGIMEAKVAINQNMVYGGIRFSPQSGTPSELKAPSIFPSYHSSISDALYGNGLIHYNLTVDNVKYPLIQNIGLYKHCLICAQSLSSELFHCNSESHMLNLKKPHLQLLLKKYHNVFVQLPIKLQIQQKYFRKGEQLDCILCSASIPYDSKLILEHVRLPQHISKQERFEASPSTSRDSLPNQKIEVSTKKNKQSPKKDSLKRIPQIPLEYSPAAKEKLFKDLQDYSVIVNSKNYFLFRHSMLGIRCILCNDSPTLNPVEHMKTNNHNQQLTNRKTLNLLRTFHDKWVRLGDLQEHQFYIIQEHCRRCHVTTSLDNVKEHILSKKHMTRIQQENAHRPCCSDSKKNGPVETKVNEVLAAVPKVKTDILENGTRRDHIEKDQVNGAVSETPEITLNYTLGVKDILYCGLAQYTITLDTVNYPYLRRTYFGIRCLLCGDAEANDIEGHLKSKHHVQMMKTPLAYEAVRNFHQFWLMAVHHQLEQAFFLNQRCFICREVVNSETALNEHIPSKRHRIGSDGVHDDDPVDRLGLKEKFRYCEEADTAFYKDFRQGYRYYADFCGIVPMPVLRITSEGVRCILCDDAGVVSPKFHVTLPAHEQALQDPQKLEKLWNFHKLWQNMSPRAQMHQQHVILMMCIACDKKLNFETAEAHILTKAHKGNVKLKEQKQSTKTVTPKHNVKESAINPKSQIITEQLPSYLSYHLKVLALVKYNEVICTPCKKTFRTLVDLRRHLHSTSHCKLSNLQKFKGKFFCEICATDCNNEAAWLDHLSNGDHVNRIDKLGDSRRANIKEHTCDTCRMIIFGDAISLLRHGKNDNDNDEPKVPLNKELQELLSSREQIVETAEKLLMSSERGLAESKGNVRACCVALEKALRVRYPHCNAYPFGSRVTGLGNNSSDLDVFIDIGNVYDGTVLQSASSQATIVQDVGALLSKQSQHFSHINLVPGARTPIVQVLHNDTGIDCDISFRHGLSVENTNFIKFCLELQPIMKPAMLFLKNWLAKSELPYGTLTSYALTMLFIFFLQRLDYLLPVVKIRQINKCHGPIIDGWEAITYNKPIKEMKTYVKECTLPIPDLLKEFFKFYSKFDFNSLVICPLLGKTLNKFSFHERNPNLPQEMARYVQKLNSANPEQFKCRTAMCVQDPFDLSHNVTKACSGDFVKVFLKYCRLSQSRISALK